MIGRSPQTFLRPPQTFLQTLVVTSAANREQACFAAAIVYCLVYVHQFFKQQLSHRKQLLAGHRHVTCNQCLIAHRLPGKCYQLRVDFFQPLLQTIFFQFDPVSGKRGGIYDMAAGFYIPPLQMESYLPFPTTHKNTAPIGIPASIRFVRCTI